MELCRAASDWTAWAFHRSKLRRIMKKAKILFASDTAPIRGFAQIMKEEPHAVYGDLLPHLQQADYSIVNLESPLSCPNGLITKSGAAFSVLPYLPYSNIYSCCRREQRTKRKA